MRLAYADEMLEKYNVRFEAGIVFCRDVRRRHVSHADPLQKKPAEHIKTFGPHPAAHVSAENYAAA